MLSFTVINQPHHRMVFVVSWRLRPIFTLSALKRDTAYRLWKWPISCSTGFPLALKVVTFNDIEWRTCFYMAVILHYFTAFRSFVSNYVKAIEVRVDPYCLRQKFSPKNLFCGNVWRWYYQTLLRQNALKRSTGLDQAESWKSYPRMARNIARLGNVTAELLTPVEVGLQSVEIKIHVMLYR